MPYDINGRPILLGAMVAIATLSYKSAHLRIGEVKTIIGDKWVRVYVPITRRSVDKPAKSVVVIG